MTRATADQIEKLVLNLEKFPYIWDTSLPNFHDRHMRAQQWQGLAETCGLSVEDTRKVYETHRKYFRTEHKHRMTELQNGLTTTVTPRANKYKYYEPLSFLIDTLKNKTSHMTSIDYDSNDSPAENNSATAKPPRSPPPSLFECNSDFSGSETAIPMRTASTSSSASQTGNMKRKTEQLSELQHNFKRRIPSMIEIPPDDVAHWCVTLANDLRMITNPLKRRKLMIKLSSIVVDAIEQEVTEQQNGDESPISVKFI